MSVTATSVTPPSPATIRYEFVLPDGAHRSFEVKLDPDVSRPPAAAMDATDATTTAANVPAPEWCRLSFHQCPACPLQSAEVKDCPAAIAVAAVVESFAAIRSYEEVEVRVIANGRETRKRAAVQDALSSLMGAHLAASGCPVLSRLRPLVRFHLPFASEEETVFRAVSMYLLGQFLVQESGGAPDWSLAGLAALYQQIGQVNRAFAARLRAAVRNDANLNALVVLDTFAKALPDTIQDRLAELRYLYEPRKPA